MNTNQNNAALWQCDECGIWWCSQPRIEPTTFMLDLSIDLLEEMGWENFRGWRLGGSPHVATCPECNTIGDAPLLGTVSEAPQLRMPLGDLLHPLRQSVPAA